MVWSTRADGYHDFYNERWYDFTGVAPGSTDGADWNAVFHPDDQPRALSRWHRSLATGEPYEIDYRLRHHGGDYRWVLGRAQPVRNEFGKIERWFGTCTDIHDRIAAETETAKLAAVIEQSADFIGIADTELRLQYLNPAGRGLLGFESAGEMPGGALVDYLAPEAEELVRTALRPALERASAWDGELALRHARSGEITPVLYSIFPIRNATGALLGYASIARDLRERKSAEHELELVARELSHRIKNIFAVVVSLVTLAARADPAAADFARGVRGRIGALAQAHEYVRPHSLESLPDVAGQTFRGLLAMLLAPYQDDARQRLSIDGEDVPIGVRAATAIALVVHELATNAVKYGALSVPSGTVAAHCARDGDKYVFTWREKGGPAVKGPPERAGFGTVMSARVVASQLGAEMHHDWQEDGLVVRLVASVDRLKK